MPEEYVAYGDGWRDLNPGWEVLDWDESIFETSWIQNKEIYQVIKDRATRPSVELWTQIADLAGYELTYRYGGIYMNVDVKAIKPLSVMFEHHPACLTQPFAAREYPGNFVVNAFTGGHKKDPFWKAVLDFIPSHFLSFPEGTEMVHTTGPQMLTKVWQQRNDMYALPVHVINPVAWQDIPHGTTPDGVVDESAFPEDTVGLHTWGHKLNGRSNIVP